MNKLVRIIAFILLIGSTVIFVLKLKFSIPIGQKHLITFFIIGAVNLVWANYRNKSIEK